MRRTQGFTLVELLLALAITSVLVVLLANVVSATLAAWQQGRNRLDTFGNARQVIGRMADEISAAVAQADQLNFVENTTFAGGGNPIPTTSESVFFIAPYPNSGSGDLCVIAYRHNAAARTLERAFADSATAWDKGPADAYKLDSYSGTDAIEWRTVAEGVLEFELRSYSQENLDANEDPEDSWDSRNNTEPTMAGRAPRRVVVRLKVVDDRTVARLKTMAAGTAGYDAAIRTSSREFFADFRLPAK